MCRITGQLLFPLGFASGRWPTVPVIYPITLTYPRFITAIGLWAMAGGDYGGSPSHLILYGALWTSHLSLTMATSRLVSCQTTTTRFGKIRRTDWRAVRPPPDYDLDKNERSDEADSDHDSEGEEQQLRTRIARHANRVERSTSAKY